MYQIKNFEENPNVKITSQLGSFKVLEHQTDLSVTKETAQMEYFASQMNVKRKQLVCDLNVSDVNLQVGAMQWMIGDVSMNTGIKGAGDLMGKLFRGAVTGESAVKPEYSGTGAVVLEPTYKHILLLDTNDWGGSFVVEDGMYLASESNLKQKVILRSTFSSAALGGEGLFNLGFQGSGVVALESDVPWSELVEIDLNNDTLKIDGNLAIAWSTDLKFTVERASKSLLGSSATGEGFVNVYQGTGKVLMAPMISPNRSITTTLKELI